MMAGRLWAEISWQNVDGIRLHTRKLLEEEICWENFRSHTFLDLCHPTRKTVAVNCVPHQRACANCKMLATCIDNVDFALSAINGWNTFQSMSSIKCITSAPGFPASDEAHRLELAPVKEVGHLAVVELQV
ncbi:uncharacterized protein LOC124722616 [Schistocerca piceifrons]|uniref:uncharacterized protein LOC124722616 n=1 Tax=Schistocerca piceifrons TaxID=274613 RepID=UPI001F5EE7D6|nr:uncharacterized protein LOC124722616 [Schistocerca piceifrons]